MHVRRMGSGWQVQVYAGRDAAGRKRYRYATRRTRKAALDAGDDLRADIKKAAGLAPDATIADLLTRWFDHGRAARGWSPGNVTNLRYQVEKIKRHPIAEKTVQELRTSDLDEYYAWLRTHGGPDGGPLAASTVVRIHSSLSSALAQAVRWDIITASPAVHASPGAVDPNEAVAPLDDDVARVIRAAVERSPDFGAFLALTAVTGARRSELLALQWRDIDGADLHLRRSLVYGDHGVEVKDWPKSRKSRHVAVDVDSEWILADLRGRARARAEACEADLLDTSFVFSHDPAGRRPWLPSTVTHQFIAVRRHVAAPESLKLHSLRHYVASVLIGAGVDIAVVANRLGHARASTTLDIYTHMIEANDRAAAEVVGAVVHRRTPSSAPTE